MTDSIARLAQRYPGKRVVVTGAASGLGLALAGRFAEVGWTVGLLDREQARLEAAVARWAHGNARALVADVTDEKAVTDAIDEFADAAGGLDILINNAGVALAGRLRDIPAADWRWIFDVNLMGVVHGCRAGLPHLQAQGGLIVNVASAAAFISSPEMSGYNASKAAVLSLSETLYGELLDEPVDVCVALPAFFQTNLLERLRAPADQHETARLLMAHADITVAQVADTVLTGMATGRFYILAPDKLKVLWRFKRFMPVRYLKRLPKLREKRIAALSRLSANSARR